MGLYDVSYNYYNDIKSLKESMALFPVEVQLVWLLEIALLSAYMANRDKCKINHNQQHTFYFKDLLRCSKDIPNMSLPMLKLLIDYRNTFVHKGAVAAKVNYSVLCLMYKKELNDLADLLHVGPLNYDITCML